MSMTKLLRIPFSFWRQQAGNHVTAMEADAARLKDDVSEVLGSRILLGSLIPSHTWDTLIKHRVKNVVTAHNGEGPRFPEKLNYRVCKLADGYQQLILLDALDAFPLLERALSLDHGAARFNQLDSYGAVYVHCTKGISRSSSVIIAYLVARMGFTTDNAIRLLQSKRSVVYPNVSFYLQLKRFESLVQQCIHSIEVDRPKRLSNTQHSDQAQRLHRELISLANPSRRCPQLTDLIPSVETIRRHRFDTPFEEFMDAVAEALERGGVSMDDVMGDLKALLSHSLDLCLNRVDGMVRHRREGPTTRATMKRKKFTEASSSSDDPEPIMDQGQIIAERIFGKWTPEEASRRKEAWEAFGAVLENITVYKFDLSFAFTSSDRLNDFQNRCEEAIQRITKLTNIFDASLVGVHYALCIGDYLKKLIHASRPASSTERLPPPPQNGHVFIEIGPSEPTTEELRRVEGGEVHRMQPKCEGTHDDTKSPRRDKLRNDDRGCFSRPYGR